MVFIMAEVVAVADGKQLAVTEAQAAVDPVRPVILAELQELVVQVEHREE
jgi:hypothetical protein